MNAYDPHADLRAALAAGKTIQANRGSDDAPDWVTLEDPQFTCAAEKYRVAPEHPAE